SVLGPETPYYSLSIWHGLNLPLLMSVLALVGGVLIYILYYRRLRTVESTPLVQGMLGQRLFVRLLLTATSRWSAALLHTFGTQRLQPQLFIVIGLALAAGVAAGWARLGNLPLPETFGPVLGIVWLLGGISADRKSTRLNSSHVKIS